MAVLTAVVDALRLDALRASRGALREGLLYDLIGRAHDHDIRDSTVQNLMVRYHIDAAHAKRVRDTALSLLAQTAVDWDLTESSNRLLLAWAADLHEIGMDIAHNHYHRHGGYLLAHMDMPGFFLAGPVFSLRAWCAAIGASSRWKPSPRSPGNTSCASPRCCALPSY